MPRLYVPTTALPQHDKPLPTPPGLQSPASPTLTNPDYILPSHGRPSAHSPPRLTRRAPSSEYLRDSHVMSEMPFIKKERHQLGLMSRKMMLLRSRTTSGGQVNGKNKGISQASPAPGSPGFIPSSPILQDVGNLAPEQPDLLQLPEQDPDRRSASGGSSASDLSGLASFLSRYAKPDGASDDEALYEGDGDESVLGDRFPSNATIAEEEHDEERRKQQEEEYNSAILSRRAEQILANAKKRLNVMEGNLRGARDLVAPLTAANLKRATSLGSAHYTPSYARRYVEDEYQTQNQQTPRKLTTQASSPSMGRDYQGHARGFSENDMPERSYSSLEYSQPRMPTHPPARVNNVAHALRGSKSFDSLGAGSGVGYGVGRDRPLHAWDSPDSSQLETLQEADERRSFYNSTNGVEGYNNGLGLYRPSSRTSDLREQMSTLKGKISTLKERAREDNLRRKSQSSLKSASPFNNALAAAPEFFYTSSATYGAPLLDTNAGVGWTSNSSSSPASPQMGWDHGRSITGSRNAFAEQAAAQKERGLQQARVVNISPQRVRTPDSKFQIKATAPTNNELSTMHRRTPSGTAIIQPAKNRYSHHQRKNSPDVPGAFLDDDYLEVPSPASPDGQNDSSSASSGPSPRSEDTYVPSEDGTSIYEDASSLYDTLPEGGYNQDDQSPVVAHEDREDAFDYEQFFLHSAMTGYGNGRRGSVPSDASVSSGETARGPRFAGHEDEEEYVDEEFPPPAPETPERLREIERNLHKRAFSDESVTTVNTFATAEEDQVSPIKEAANTFDYPEQRAVTPVHKASRIPSRTESRQATSPDQRPPSRPGTAVRRHVRTDSSSDRADSGVGLPRRSLGSDVSRLPGPSTTKSVSTTVSAASRSTPPTSPQSFSHQDPATLAVNALLNLDGKPLGLRNKAILFGVVESLRKVVHQLQEVDESHYEARMLRKKLDEAKLALDGKNLG